MFQKLFAAVLVIVAFSFSCLAQGADLDKRVADALNDVKEKRYEKVSELRGLGEKVFPSLAKYTNDPNEDVRREIVALLRTQTSSGALELLGQYLIDKAPYIADHALDTIHNEYTCTHVKASASAKSGLKGYLARKPNSAKAVLLLSCLSDDNETFKLIAERRKEKGVNEDSGIHYGVVFNLSVEMALAANGDAQALAKAKAYVKEGEVKNLFFILDNIKFVRSKELLFDLVELLKDQRPAFEPIAHSDSMLRVCDLALTALTSADPTVITMNYGKQKRYSDEEIKTKYAELKARLGTASKSAAPRNLELSETFIAEQ